MCSLFDTVLNQWELWHLSKGNYIDLMRKLPNKIGLVAVIGYGSQGRAIACNLRDSGCDVRIGLRTTSKSRRKAKKDNHSCITTISRAVHSAEVLCFALPDHQHGPVYEDQIKPNLQQGTTFLFLHGLSVHFQLIVPPVDSDLILIAPHAPGMAVRESYLGDRTVSAFSAVYQDISGRADRKVLDLASAIGISRKRLIATTFEREAIGDLFGEQAVLCGGLAALIKNGFEVLLEKGFPPEAAYLEVAFQLDLIIDLIKRFGIEGMLSRISVAARLGAVETGPKLIDRSVRGRMEEVFEEVASGRFVRRLQNLSDDDLSKLDRSLSRLSHPAFERAARKLAPDK